MFYVCGPLRDANRFRGFMVSWFRPLHPCGSVWVMGEWSVGQWIVGVIRFQKMYGLYGLKHHVVEISGDVTDPDNQTTSEYRATQLLICENLSLAIPTLFLGRSVNN